jgi:putative phosphonate metabolism protein
MSLPRYALYVTLPPETPLARFGAAALGYECEGGKTVAQAVPVGLDPAHVASATATPRRYGFHATIVAPFQLAPGSTRSDLISALQSFASARKPCAVGRLRLVLLSRFLALVPSAPTPAISAFAADTLMAFNEFRAPPTTAERERRTAAGLSARQLALLDRWGYPYVFEEFRFHMTLAGPLPAADGERWIAAYQTAFAPLAHHALVVDALSLLCQEEPVTPFRLVRRQPLTG